ncbi:molybdenum hydroxylase [Azorhizobium oxalatiphilum]|uniref:Molybdenum hydroxylase n=1 Tax=Azorhizobium oxalatiphilum TaxID=980631 RepID=A0A917CDT0_9HYPH|nr:hypothetical protein [Azorhizobium oxalatiphilum]GGF85474.1 molybdenum hydroxylase [Azorhizobium oxalatiphilum]
MRNETDFRPSRRAPVAVVLGTNDVASAVACRLFQAGYGVVVSRDPAQPVLRRSMAFDDALVTGFSELMGVTARPTHALVEVLRGFTERNGVMVTTMELGDLLCLGLIDLLVDARLRLRSLKVDIRPFARLTIGLGPGFTAGRHVDVAVETAPEAIGVLREGSTLAAHGRSAPLAGAGRERFARAVGGGLWLTDCAIGDRVTRDAVIGTCNDVLVTAPLTGHLRGLVRSGVDVPDGLKLLEVDPGSEPSWLGPSERAQRIAAATLDAVRTMETMVAGAGVSH